VVRRPLVGVAAELEERDERNDDQEQLEDDEGREDVVPERRGQAAALPGLRAERPAVGHDPDDREQRGDDEGERDETAPGDARSVAGPI
jgi:hypothetical protein